MYTRENLPPDVALLLASFQVERESLTDRFISICNEKKLDGLAIYEELCTLSYRGKCHVDIRNPMNQLTVMDLFNNDE